jgi:uncharacterized membrane protein YoaK (UPF0700 family)
MHKNLANKVGWLFGLVMTIVFFACGIVFMFSDFMIENLPKPNRTYLALVFLAYAVIRAIRLYQQYKKFKTNEDRE